MERWIYMQGMIKGVSVKLLVRTQNGIDGFNNPIYTETEVVVDNVLYHPTTVDDVVDTTRLNGTKELYTLAIPKGDTHVWLHNLVQFADKTWNCYAEQEAIDANVPGEWHKKVLVERYDG